MADTDDWRPNAHIQLGDLGNSHADTQQGWSITREARRPAYVVIGNHDEEQDAYPGPTNSAVLEGNTYWQQASPFYQTFVLTSGDNSLTARVLVLDGNLDISEDRLGLMAGNAVDRYLGATQITWAQAVLAADTTSVAVLILMHHSPADHHDFAAFLDVLAADGRPTTGFYCHGHEHALRVTALATDSTPFYFYKPPALSGTSCWCRATLSLVEGAIVAELDVRGFHANATTEDWYLDLDYFTYTDNVNEAGYELQEIAGQAIVVAV